MTLQMTTVFLSMQDSFTDNSKRCCRSVHAAMQTVHDSSQKGLTVYSLTVAVQQNMTTLL